jgi:hypothetical protein
VIFFQIKKTGSGVVHNKKLISLMIKTLHCDLFECTDAFALVNTVNCVGVMGKGIALEFKKRFPAMYGDYVKKCRRGEVKPGVPYLYHDSFSGVNIINFPNKRSLEKPFSGGVDRRRPETPGHSTEDMENNLTRNANDRMQQRWLELGNGRLSAGAQTSRKGRSSNNHLR